MTTTADVRIADPHAQVPSEGRDDLGFEFVRDGRAAHYL